jgi:hypothetical protein
MQRTTRPGTHLHTSKNGRYHCRRFADLATELGLQVGKLPPYGFAAATLTFLTVRRFSTVLRELGDALVLWREAEPHADPAAGRSRASIICRCACPRRLRLPASAIAEALVICGRCGQPFLPAAGASA